MTGETNLSRLLAEMTPVLAPESYAFCTTNMPIAQWALLDPVATFKESEGTTLVLEMHKAQRAGWAESMPMCCITLNVHSSLEAVGLTAAVASALGKQNISANVIAAYYHDHIFVPVGDAQRALQTLQQLSREHQLSSK